MRKALAILGITAVGLGLAGGATAAEKMSYSYIDLGYTYHQKFQGLQNSGPDLEGGGITFEGQVAVSNSIHAMLHWSDQSLNIPTDVEFMAAGLGYHRSLNDRTDVVVDLMYLQAKTDPAGTAFGNDYSGRGINLGLRTQLNDKWELEGGLVHQDIGSFLDDTLVRVKGRYQYNSTFSWNMGVDLSDQRISWSTGFRLSFGN